MRFAQAALGRVFVLRLEDGDTLPGTVEEFARDHDVRRAACLLVGGAKGGSRLVVGPEHGDETPPRPVTIPLGDVHEIAAVGTIFPGPDGNPSLHMHASCGRGKEAVTGCVRPGLDIWKVGELVLLELTETSATREADPATGFCLLSP